jgi:hypothetical protein
MGRIEIFEQFCRGKYPAAQEKNEDGLVITPDFVMVVDGASSATPVRGQAGGRVLKTALCAMLPTLPKDATAEAFVDAANAAINAALAPWDPAEPPPMACVVVYSRARHEMWRVGDCSYAVNGEWRILEPFPHEEVMHELRYPALAKIASIQERIEALPAPLAVQMRREINQKLMQPILDLTPTLVNNAEHTWGYAALNGKPVLEIGVETLPEEAEFELILTSDGALVNCAAPEEGPAHVEQVLANHQELLAEDPECLRLFAYWRGFLPGTDLLDDVTFVRFTVAR